MDKFTKIENLTAFLLQTTGSIFGEFKGTMSATEQRRIFGEFLGKGKIVVSGKLEELGHIKKIAFGQDYEYTSRRWSEL